MEGNIKLIDFCKKWESLGIKTSVLKVCGQLGSKKLISESLKLSDVDIDSYQIPDEFNFIGIFLKESDLMCLDVDPVTPSSIPNFYDFLRDKGIDINSLLIENSLNGGLHVYFRLNGRKIKNTHFLEYNGIHFDLLTRFRVFTTPSRFGKKKYEWIGGGISSINSFDEIPEFPDFIYEMIGNHDCVG